MRLDTTKITSDEAKIIGFTMEDLDEVAEKLTEAVRLYEERPIQALQAVRDARAVLDYRRACLAMWARQHRKENVPEMHTSV